MKSLAWLAALCALLIIFFPAGCASQPSTTTVNNTITTTRSTTVTQTATETIVQPTTTITVTQTVTTPPTTQTPMYRIVVPISYHVPDKTAADWTFIWQTTIENLTDANISLFLTVEFLDITSILVKRTIATANFAPGETKTVEGDVEMIAEIANTVRKVTLDVRVN